MLFALIAIGTYGIKRFIEHERLQDEKIADLQIQIAHYRAECGMPGLDVPGFTEDSCSYLAIGNSITKYPVCDYW